GHVWASDEPNAGVGNLVDPRRGFDIDLSQYAIVLDEGRRPTSRQSLLNDGMAAAHDFKGHAAVDDGARVALLERKLGKRCKQINFGECRRHCAKCRRSCADALCKFRKDLLL